MSSLKHWVRTLVCITLGTAAAYLLLKYVAPLVAPFIIAMFLAVFIEPLVRLLQDKARLPRAAAVGISMVVIFGGLVVMLVFAITRLIVELVHLTAYLPSYVNEVKEALILIQNRIESYYFKLPADVIDFINTRITDSEYNLESIVVRVQVIIGKFLNFVLQLVSSVPAWVILVIISGIATYFMSTDKRVIVNFWLKAIPKPWGRKSLEITKQIIQAIISYVRAQFILISITFMQSLIGLSIIKAPYVLIMGLAIGIADIIPVLGPSSIFLPWITWELITGDTAFAIKLTVVFAFVLVVRQVLETKIVSHSMGLHPLATLIAMYVGLKLLGPLGVIAGPLFIIALKAFAAAGLIGWEAEED